MNNNFLNECRPFILEIFILGHVIIMWLSWTFKNLKLNWNKNRLVLLEILYYTSNAKDNLMKTAIAKKQLLQKTALVANFDLFSPKFWIQKGLVTKAKEYCLNLVENTLLDENMFSLFHGFNVLFMSNKYITRSRKAV